MIADFPSIEEIARRMLAIEAARDRSHAERGNEGEQRGNEEDSRVDEAVRVCARLQAALSRLTGATGYSSLLSRAVALAKAEVPLLKAVQVRPDGSLAGFDRIERGRDSGELEKGREVLVTRLLGLLATFIGESLTRRIASEA